MQRSASNTFSKNDYLKLYEKVDELTLKMTSWKEKTRCKEMT